MYHHLSVFGLLSTLLLTATCSPVSPAPASSKDVLAELDAQGLVVEWQYTDNGGRYATFPPGVFQDAEGKLNSRRRSVDEASMTADVTTRDSSGLTYTVECYNSGEWASQSMLNSGYPEACQVFSGSNAQKGSVLVHVTNGWKGSKELDLVYRKEILSDSSSANIMQHCYTGYSTLIYASKCQGDNSDTQGGKLVLYENGVDMVRFVVDPNVSS